MKKLICIYLLLFTTSISFTSLQAALVWDNKEGWTTQGGLLEGIFGNNLELKNAWDTLQAGRHEEAAGHTRAALGLYKQVYTKYCDSRLAPEALYRRGQLFVKSCQYESAFGMFQRIITDYPNYPRYNDIIGMQFQIASRLQKGERPYYWGIIPGFKDYDAAVCYFEKIVQHAPYSVYAPMALMNIAELSRSRKKYPEAIDALDRLINSYKHSTLAPKAYLMLADVYECLSQGPERGQASTLKAIDYCQDFLFLYPGNEDVKKAESKLRKAQEEYSKSKLILGNFYYERRNNSRAARIYYNEAISVAPNSQAAKEARGQLALIAEGIPAKKTWVDMIFGRYERPSRRAYLEETVLTKQAQHILDDRHQDLKLGEAAHDIEEYLSGEENSSENYPDTYDLDEEDLELIETSKALEECVGGPCNDD